MNLIKVGAAILNQTPLDWDGNFNNIKCAIEEARKAGVSILCLPELCLSGYGCEDAFYSPSISKTALDYLKKIIPLTSNINVCLGLPVLFQKRLYNAAAFISNRKLYGFVCKQFLAGHGVHYEQRWFTPWQKSKKSKIKFHGEDVSIGDFLFNVENVKIGIEICEDAWRHNRPARDMADLDVDIILNPSASHFAFGKLEVRKQILLESSRFCNAVYIYTNLVGCEAGRIIYDGGSMIANCGKLLAQGKRFTYKKSLLLNTVIDLDVNTLNKVKDNLQNTLKEINKDSQINIPFKFPVKVTKNKNNNVCKWENSQNLKNEEFMRAVGLALYDYMRKSRSLGFVLSLSGGIDSGSIAVLIYYMVNTALLELGETSFMENFKFLFQPGEKTDKAKILKRILTCAYQSSSNSGKITFNAAKTLAETLGFTFYHFKINDLVSEYVELIEKNIGRKLSWERDDVTLQNIQARVRGPSVWMLANINNALLLTTSNRSEAAVGYATMDGDTCGGLCPLGGIDKKFLIKWMHWVKGTGPEGLNPIPEIKLITDQKPTAELRPANNKQTDEDDLMPYNILDRIEKAFVREKKDPEDIYETLKDEFTDISGEQLKNYINKFLRLWKQNQWKRERYAPSFHVDDESLDPKSSCRYPILSGTLKL